MVASSKFLTVEEFASRVAQLPVCTDVEVDPGWRFELDGSGVHMSGMRAGALPLYQVKGLTSTAVNLTSSTRLEARALTGDEAAEGRLLHAIGVLNEGLSAHAFESNPLTARTYLNDAGAQVVGGIVTGVYTPLTHLELVERMLDVPALVEEAKIDSYHVSVSRLSATMLVGDQEWQVDGGLKAGMFIGNGQFGDKARKIAAMLFRLLCTNGMMDVVDGEVSRRRHVGEPMDLAADLASVLDRADRIFTASKASMASQVDVVEALIDLHRRGYLGRGPLRRALESRNEVLGGRQVEGSETTLWGLAQSITAAARSYSFHQMSSLGQLAGRLVFEGLEAVTLDRPVPVNAPTYGEVWEEFVAAEAV